MKLLLALLTVVSSYSLFCVEKRFISLCVIIFIIIVVSLKYRHNRKYLIFLIILCSVFITLSLVQIKTFQNNGTYTGIVLEKKSSYVIIFDGLEKIYFRTKDLNIDLFDIVKVDGNLIDFQPYKKPLESGFDFLKYLNDKGVRREIVSNSYTTIFNNGINIVQFKSRIINQFNQGVEQVLVKALLFGDGSYDDKVFLSLRSAGLLVLMNLSGLLINSLFYNLKRILSIKFNEKKTELIAFILILPLLILNLDSPSIIRIYLYRSICLFLVLKDKKIDYLSVKSIPFLCLIFCDRFLINSFSIILPLVVSFGIYFANTLINSKILFVKKVYFRLILTLFILPFNIYFNKCFNVANILITSALIPINAIIVALLMPSILGMKLPFSGLILNADYKFLELCNFKYLNINGPQMNQYVITIYYVVLMCLIYFMEARNRYIYKKILMGFVISLCFYFIPINNFIYMSVNFINVGQGDSTLITYRGQNILIDTGGSLKEDIATNYLIPFFRKNKIYKIDYVFITHYDMDHYYALDSLKKNFIVGNIYDYNNFKDMKIGNLSIYNKNINMQESVEENDKSLVLNFIINDISLLLMGDAPKSVEYEIMRKWPEMTVDYLKCGHHGSNTSTSYEFISWLHPKEAIISCGENNKYGHPHKEVIDCLKQENVIIRRTDEEGTIKYRFFV